MCDVPTLVEDTDNKPLEMTKYAAEVTIETHLINRNFASVLKQLLLV